MLWLVSSSGGAMEIVRTVLYLVLAVLFPVGAVVFAVRSQGRGAPSGRSWSVYLHGDGPPHPARSVNGRLVVGNRLRRRASFSGLPRLSPARNINSKVEED